MATSKFSSLVQAKQEQSLVSEERAEPISVETQEPVSFVAAELEKSEISAPPQAPTINMQPTRGKKGHPDYNQVTIYLKKETQNKTKIALLQDRDERDFSELVEDLLIEWLERKAGS